MLSPCGGGGGEGGGRSISQPVPSLCIDSYKGNPSSLVWGWLGIGIGITKRKRSPEEEHVAAAEGGLWRCH